MTGPVLDFSRYKPSINVLVCNQSHQIENGCDSDQAWYSQKINPFGKTQWQYHNDSSHTHRKVSILPKLQAKIRTDQRGENSVVLI